MVIFKIAPPLPRDFCALHAYRRQDYKAYAHQLGLFYSFVHSTKQGRNLPMKSTFCRLGRFGVQTQTSLFWSQRDAKARLVSNKNPSSVDNILFFLLVIQQFYSSYKLE